MNCGCTSQLVPLKRCSVHAGRLQRLLACRKSPVTLSGRASAVRQPWRCNLFCRPVVRRRGAAMLVIPESHYACGFDGQSPSPKVEHCDAHSAPPPAGILEGSKTKQRKFQETIELQIGLKNYDPQKDKRFSGTVKLPYTPRPQMKVTAPIRPPRLTDATTLSAAECFTLLQPHLRRAAAALPTASGFIGASSCSQRRHHAPFMTDCALIVPGHDNC